MILLNVTENNDSRTVLCSSTITNAHKMPSCQPVCLSACLHRLPVSLGFVSEFLFIFFLSFSLFWFSFQHLSSPHFVVLLSVRWMSDSTCSKWAACLRACHCQKEAGGVTSGWHQGGRKQQAAGWGLWRHHPLLITVIFLTFSACANAEGKKESWSKHLTIYYALEKIK